jgi:methylated-DNA-[protein]-cysteine S-methyltransferase
MRDMPNLAERHIDSPLGRLRLVADAVALHAVYFAEQARAGAEALPEAAEHPVLATAASQLADYFAGTRTTFDLPLAFSGSAFQGRVWRGLLDVPFAAQWSYAQLAAHVGAPRAMRAVGAANGRNPLAIVVPCHRVVGADGSLTGYGGGLPAKRWLLAHEAAVAGRRGARPG